mmetsp:Transcript_12192/g.31319  ORF Transcript_12192/g.31319 Transcript_12192/m.31319 type:complete len:659 (-) Transcript_12192:312-2288(-)
MPQDAQVPSGSSSQFKRGIDIDRKPKFGADVVCGVIFYIAFLANVVLCFAIFGSKNSEMPTQTREDVNVFGETFANTLVNVCPEGMFEASSCQVPWFYDDSDNTTVRQNRYLIGGHHRCVTQDLCTQILECTRETLTTEKTVPLARRLSEGGGAHPVLRRISEALGLADPERTHDGRSLQALNPEAVPDNTWDFLEQYIYQPITLFVTAFIVASGWLVLLWRFPLASIWGTIVADIVCLVAAFIWFKLEVDVWNFPCIVLAVLLLIMAIVMKSKIDGCSVIMKAALDGLMENKRIFLVCAGVVLAWVAFFVLWVTGLIGMSFVNEVVAGELACEFNRQGWAGSWTSFFFILNMFWVTYFFRNINLIIVAATVSGWYFNTDGYSSYWVKALRWGFADLAGGNAFASATQGAADYLLSRTGSCWRVLFGMLNPIDWVLMCVGHCLRGVLHAFTKFGLIAHTYTGTSFCQAAFDGMRLLKSQLGEAVLTDYIGKRVMSWATYIISLCIAFAAWAWADQAQGLTTLSQIDASTLLVIVCLYAWLLSNPFYTLVLVVLLETWVFGGSSVSNLELRAIFNSIFASLFMGAMTFFILENVSHIVVNAMDSVFFCFAVEAQLTEEAEQERFAKLYESIKAEIQTGVPSTSAVVGKPPGNETPVAPV